VKRLYVIGDSISIQYGPYLERYLAGRMVYARKGHEDTAALALDPPQSANGGDSSMVLAFVSAKAAASGFAADVALLNCGLWDLRADPQTGAKQVPVTQYGANLAEIVDILHAEGVAVAWVRTTPCDEAVHNKREMGFHRYAADVVAYNEAADAVMSAHNVPTLDLHTFTLNLGDNLYCDHVHFNEHVREKQAAFIAGWLAAWDAVSRKGASGG